MPVPSTLRPHPGEEAAQLGHVRLAGPRAGSRSRRGRRPRPAGRSRSPSPTPPPGTTRPGAGRPARRARSRPRDPSGDAPPSPRAPADGPKACAAPGSRRRGGARRTRPRRASRGPHRSTEPRSRPTRSRSGTSPMTSAQSTRRVVVPSPSITAPRPRSRSDITCTSLMRGTLVRTHARSVRRQAASNGSAAFLLPPTSIRPSRRWPPSTTRLVRLLPSGLAMSSSNPGSATARPPASNSPRYTTSSRRTTPNPSATAVRHDSIRRRTSAARAPPSFTMKLACRGDTTAPPMRRPLSPARSMRAPADRGTPSGSGPSPGRGFWNTQPADACPRGCVRLRKASERRAAARSADASPRPTLNSAQRTSSPVCCTRLSS